MKRHDSLIHDFFYFQILKDSDKHSPLHGAAYGGHSDVLDLLLMNGARVNCKDSQWITPLHRACRTNSEVGNSWFSHIDHIYINYNS